MRLVLHKDVPEDTALRGQWNELVQRMECPEIFYTYEWALAVARAYRASMLPLLLLAYEGDSLIGVASLAIDNLQKQVSFLAASTADYCDFISVPGNRARLVELVLKEMRRLRLPALALANMPEDSATSSSLKRVAAEEGYCLFSRPAYRCAQVRFAAPDERRSVKEALYGKKKLRRRLKSLSETGAVQIRHLKSWAEIAERLPAFAETQVARFTARGRPSNLARSERQVFLAELAKLLSGSDWIRLSCLTSGDQQVAWNYGFQFAGSWFWYQPAFDMRYQSYDPGLCLLSKIIEEACDTPEIDRVDLGLGTESYKERFATHGRQTSHITISASAARHLTAVMRYNAASALKSSPVLDHWARQVLRRGTSGGRHA